VENNFYFEQAKKYLSTVPDEILIGKISVCQTITDKLAKDEVWQLLVKDARDMVKRLDSTWQECYDEKQLNQIRVLKLAYKHISELPKKYGDDLKIAKEELDRRQNAGDEIEMDYDAETNFEESNG
jgi:hypothetical protein